MSDQEDLISQARAQKAQDPNDVANFEKRCLKEYLSLQNQKIIQYLRLQLEWSCYVKWFLGCSFILTWGMIISLGLGFLKFEKYPMLPYEIVGGFFAQVLGLGYVVVKYLFPIGKIK